MTTLGEELLPKGAKVANDELMRLKFALLASARRRHKLLASAPGGERLSKRRGQGLDFAEVRAYQPGDDVRAIHWRVTARSSEAHTKIFHEQREQPLLLVIDASAAMHFGTAKRFKIVQALSLATLFAWHYALAGERVGVVLVDGERSWGSAPQHGHYAVAKVVQAMLRCFAQPPQAPLAELYQFIPSRMRAHARLIFIGDGASLERNHAIFLTRLARHNEILAAAVYDRMERELPNIDMSLSAAGKKLRVAGADRATRADFKADFQQRLQRLATNYQQLGAQFAPLATDESALELFWRLS